MRREETINFCCPLSQSQELTELVDQFAKVFSSNSRPLWYQNPYGNWGKTAVTETPCQDIEEEVSLMLRWDHWGVHQPQSSLIIIVQKPAGSMWLCNDFQKPIKFSDYDSYPLPWVNNLLEWLGLAHVWYLSLQSFLNGTHEHLRKMMCCDVAEYQEGTSPSKVKSFSRMSAES